jgi:hypothetical protein
VDYLWTGITPFVWNGHTYTGVGNLGAIEGISEDSDVSAQGVKAHLSGIQSDSIMQAMYDCRLMHPANIYMALFDANGVLIPDPFLIYSGLTDAVQGNDSGDTATITLNLENILVDLNRAVYMRYTDACQQQVLAAELTRLGLPADTQDTGFRFVPGDMNTVLYWGTNPPG